MNTLPGGAWLCAELNGCATLTERLPPLAGLIACVFAGVVLFFFLYPKHGWIPSLLSLMLVGLTNLLLYVRLDAGQWSPGEAAMAALFSLFGLIISLGFEDLFIKLSPRLRCALRLMTPVYSVGFTLLLWAQGALHG
ncbi:hypothetical protein [Rahnella aceris]|uniref:hypothetical protein n=1 Tax=Rahnella sp. (strain Y9602) TaxID=2703885 RepID=UPI00366A3CDC